MNGYWAIVALAAIEGGVRMYQIWAEHRSNTTRIYGRIWEKEGKPSGPDQGK